MAVITFSSPLLHGPKTVYAVAGDTRTVLALAEEHKIPIPFECRDGNCGSCLIEVTYADPSTKMGIYLTEKEKSKLKELGRLTPQEIEDAEVRDMPPRYRLACQFIARDEDVTISFTGEPGGA
ncbi:ferredoxin [Rhodobacter veldkampii DSM 11550]|uniref:Ferredoxin n=1 Tax=Phaeovulum veldkampii DSM 11550 TaxID=1185920 RepID=A0A2T4JIW6_9RHOB|nr:2Fe-2S iron-sulfur cluster binding domain-containing protein [Phaeovulum veldkampii]MBK5946826.1 ferredoxin [Phaeovulum veldkampii DSM 11550]PTE17846.1 ferredoxin [Phaeovulum veldkampii DSM 11550]TDQ63397.1 ferredoxin [Phaeovulum veldkampii DSM 11550]